MAGNAGFSVQAEALDRHAATVDEVAAHVGQARSAAATVSIGRDAYGFLCSLIPALLDPIQHQAIAALGEAADSLQRAADDVRVTARRYTDSDTRTADVFDGR
jgi:hypothetical protein